MKPPPFFLIVTIMIDEKFTQQIQRFLLLENRTEEQIIEGADLLLRINRNKAMHQQILRNPKRKEQKVVYELNKHLKYRLDGLTLAEVGRMDRKVTAQIDAMIAGGKPETDDDGADERDASQPRLGKRADHDSLPPEIQGLWDINAERYKNIKEARATVETLDAPCDRYEYLKFMSEAYAAYKRDMAKYDAYKPGLDEGKAAGGNEAAVSSARAYISKARKKYDGLLADGDNEELEKLRGKIQQRVDLLVDCNAALSDELVQWLVDNNFGINYGNEGE